MSGLVQQVVQLSSRIDNKMFLKGQLFPEHVINKRLSLFDGAMYSKHNGIITVTLSEILSKPFLENVWSKSLIPWSSHLVSAHLLLFEQCHRHLSSVKSFSMFESDLICLDSYIVQFSYTKCTWRIPEQLLILERRMAEKCITGHYYARLVSARTKKSSQCTQLSHQAPSTLPTEPSQCSCFVHKEKYDPVVKCRSVHRFW